MGYFAAVTILSTWCIRTLNPHTSFGKQITLWCLLYRNWGTRRQLGIALCFLGKHKETAFPAARARAKQRKDSIQVQLSELMSSLWLLTEAWVTQRQLPQNACSWNLHCSSPRLQFNLLPLAYPSMPYVYRHQKDQEWWLRESLQVSWQAVQVNLKEKRVATRFRLTSLTWIKLQGVCSQGGCCHYI